MGMRRWASQQAAARLLDGHGGKVDVEADLNDEHRTINVRGGHLAASERREKDLALVRVL